MDSSLTWVPHEVGADAGLQGKQPTDRTKQGGGIMALMDEMKHDLELELAELKHDEEESRATESAEPSLGEAGGFFRNLSL